MSNLANYHKFIETYRSFTGLSEAYADAIWHSLTDEARRQPEKTARDMAKHFERLQREQRS